MFDQSLRDQANALFVKAGMWDEQHNEAEAQKCRDQANALLALSETGIDTTNVPDTQTETPQVQDETI